jgi:hypothetical protein
MDASLIVFTFQINLNNSPEDCTFTDTTPYVANGVALADVRGILKLTGPSGVFYKNAGWDSDDFSAPDIDADVSLILTGTALPLDANGDVLTGTYTVEYKVDVSLTVYTATAVEYDYCFDNPEVDIDMTADCATSILTSEDNTDYDVDCNGTTVSPGTTTRTHTVKYPVDLGISDVVETADTVIVGPNIYTNIWTTTISTVLQYILPDGLIVNTTVTGIDYLDVQCDECQCDFILCIQNIVSRYEGYLNTNPKEANRLLNILTRIEAYWMLYSMAVRCGEDDLKDSYCASLVALISSETTCCSDDDDTSSQEIIPVSGSGSGITTYYNVWFNGTGVPSSSLGNNNDYYIVSTAGGGALVGDVYKKITGSWTYQFSLLGPAGSAATNLYELLNNDMTAVGTDAGTLEKDLMSYTLTAGALDANGEFLKVSALFEFATNENTKTVKLYLDGTEILGYICTGLVTSSTKYLEFEVYINRSSVAQQRIITYAKRQAVPASNIGPVWQTQTKNLALAQIIKVTGQNNVASANDIICNELKVEHFKL